MCRAYLLSGADGVSGAAAEIADDINDLLRSCDLGFSYEDIPGLGLGALWEILSGRLGDWLKAPLRCLGMILVLAVFSAVIRSITESGSGGIFRLVCALTSVSAIAPPLLDVYRMTLESIQLTASFTLVYVPIFTGITVICGGLTSAGMFHMLILAASEVIVKVSESLLLPVLSVSTALAVSGSIFPSSPGESMVRLIRKTVGMLITVTATLFTGFLSLRCSLSGRVDGAADRTARMLLSGAVPVIGGAVSEAYGTVKGSFEVIRGTIGAAGIIAIALIMLPPILEVIAFRIAMWAGAAAADMMSADSLASLLRALDEGLAIAQSVMIAQGGILVICTAIFMNALA